MVGATGSGSGQTPQDVHVTLTPVLATAATAVQASALPAATQPVVGQPAVSPVVPQALPVVLPGMKEFEHTFENGYLHLTITKNDGTVIEKYFKITGGITNPALAKKIINTYRESGALREIVDRILANEAANANLPVTDPSQETRLKLTIKADHFAVSRFSKVTGEEVGTQTAVQLGTLQGYVTQKAKIDRALGGTFEKARDQIRIKNELVNRLTSEGFQPATVKATIAQIFEEGQLGLLQDVEDDLADVTLSDLLQYPNNEAVFGALAELGKNSSLIKHAAGTRQLAEGAKNVKKCREAILDVLLRHVHRPPKVIVDRDVHGNATCAIVQRVYQGTREPATVDGGYLSLDEVTDLAKLQPLAAVDRGYSSESDKRLKKNPRLGAHNTNMGAVVARGIDGEGSVVNVRSGKTGSLARAQELAEFALRQELGSGSTAALRLIGPDKDGKPVYEFRPAITTHMDMGKGKMIGAKLELFGEDELEYTKEIAKAVDQWPPEGYRVHIEVNGALSEVVLRKPIVSNQPFSSQVEGIGIFELGQENADHFNCVANQQYLYDFIRDNPSDAVLRTELRKMQTASRDLNAVLMKKLGPPPGGGDYLMSNESAVGGVANVGNPLWGLIDFDKVKITKFYDEAIMNDKAFIKYEQKVAKFLLTKLQLLKLARASPGIAEGDKAKLEEIEKMTIALYALHFRRLPPEVDSAGFQELSSQIATNNFHIRPERNEEQLHAADLEMFRNILCNPKAAVSVKKTKCEQCKSGVDRTGLGTALAVAQERFHRKFGRTFLPGQKIALDMNGKPITRDPKYIDLLHFKKFFREAIHELAVPIVVETKGFSGLRWGEGAYPFGASVNPVPHKYLFLEDDLPHLALVDEAEAVHDVVGLNYQDLQAVGVKSQYKGSLHVPESIYLQSTADKRKAVAKRQKELNPTKSRLESQATFEARQAKAEKIKQGVRKKIEEALIYAGLRKAELPTKILNDGLQLACHISELNLDAERLALLQNVAEVAAEGVTEADKWTAATLRRIIAIAQRAQKIKRNQPAVEVLSRDKAGNAQANTAPLVRLAPYAGAADQARLNQFRHDEAEQYTAAQEREPTRPEDLIEYT